MTEDQTLMSEDDERASPSDLGGDTKPRGCAVAGEYVSPFPDQVLENVLENVLLFLTSRRDRNAVSLVCKSWYRAEALTRSELFIGNCYAVAPRRVTERFRQVRAVTLKGKPRFADFNLMPHNWGAHFAPWVTAMGYHYRALEKLCLKRMSVKDEDLELLADSFPYFKELVLVCCDGFGTSGLAVIANNCRDLQSYLSHLSLFLAPESKKFYILVDNRPWLKDLGPRSAHLWQLMVTKSRLSPFANTKARKERKEKGESLDLKANPKSTTSKSKKFRRWFSVIDAATLSRKRALLPVKKLRNSLTFNSKLHRTLYGFIVFEVAWSDVRGINYLNELQTDTSLAIEAIFMKRWEFDSIEQAAKCISSWFSGTHHEQLLLKGYLESAIGDVFYDAQENFPKASSFDENICNDDVCAGDQSPCYLDSRFYLYSANMENGSNTPHTPPPPDGPYKRRKVMNSTSSGFDVDIYPEETHSETVDSPLHSQNSYASDCEDAVEATQYKDALILFRFDDRDLPFTLREIIMSDVRLLTLLESGLPSWVIFLQSYPVFCHIYRPWMCPLARTLYVLISFVTVLIGFYDLYKNVPVLKATASRLCGPLLDWIETWEMVSRIKYLGTMLFLHNFEKAVKWFLMFTRTFRSFISMLTQPMAGPLVECLDFALPFWSMCIEIVESLCSAIWFVLDSSFSLVENIVEIVLLPVWFILSSTWTVAMSIIYPVFWILSEILFAPVRVVVAVASFLTFIFTCTHDFLRDIWHFISSAVKLASNAEATVSSYEVSVWRSLWSDLFSQIFRAVRSILNGFVAFFTACNRHRLSIYNHSQEIIRRLSRPTQGLRPEDSSHRGTRGTQNLSETGPQELKPDKKRN